MPTQVDIFLTQWIFDTCPIALIPNVFNYLCVFGCPISPTQEASNMIPCMLKYQSTRKTALCASYFIRCLLTLQLYVCNLNWNDGTVPNTADLGSAWCSGEWGWGWNHKHQYSMPHVFISAETFKKEVWEIYDMQHIEPQVLSGPLNA